MGAPGLRTVDLVVAGGGPAGAAASAAARAEGLDVELVDAGGGQPRPGESLPPGSEDVLDSLFGASEWLPGTHRPAYGTRSAWGGPGLDTLDFMDNPFGHGWHVDRGALDAALAGSLKAQGVRVTAATRIAAASWSGEGWEVDLPGGPLRARVLVDATGRSARISRSQGARRHRLDRLVAAYWRLDAPAPADDSTTLVEAVADGWWYTTPLPGGYRVVAFLTDADLLPPPAARGADAWAGRLSSAPHVWQALDDSGCRLDRAPRILDAGIAHLDALAGPGWVATGDAAVSFDPLSSQGILTALTMGRDAGRAAAAMLRHGDQEPLVAYGRDYAAVLEDHLTLRAAYYGLERRWAASPFWSRRC